MRPDARTRERLLAEVATLSWVHSIDLGDGVTTPGTWGKLNPTILRAFDGVDFRGKKVLDIGCWDGYYSFEAEKRGAREVYATDLVTQRKWLTQPTLLLAKEILGSNVRYFPNVSVYDVETLGIKDFDIVIYAGVYYHLKDPLRSFTMLRRVMKEGGTMILEGAAIASEDCYARFFYREPYIRDYSNWWVPSVGCLRQWVECSFFAEMGDYGMWDAGNGNVRHTMTARAVRRADPHYIRPEAELAPFDLNTYPRAYEDPPAPAGASLMSPMGARLMKHLPTAALGGPIKAARRWVEKVKRPR